MHYTVDYKVTQETAKNHDIAINRDTSYQHEQSS